MPEKQSKSGGARKYTRNKIKCAAYTNRDRRHKNKMRRILQSNGEKAASRYHIEHLRGKRVQV